MPPKVEFRAISRRKSPLDLVFPTFVHHVMWFPLDSQQTMTTWVTACKPQIVNNFIMMMFTAGLHFESAYLVIQEEAEGEKQLSTWLAHSCSQFASQKGAWCLLSGKLAQQQCPTWPSGHYWTFWDLPVEVLPLSWVEDHNVPSSLPTFL